ncbi:MAG: choice-of-anchor D domain-containing protein [Chlorobi bacterium]|nr:choice-of-anchor D domain-containing protein [Chlorobiota bacterium]
MKNLSDIPKKPGIPIIGLLMVLNLISYQLVANTNDWSIVATYDIPGKASGLAYDGTYLYFGIYGSGGDQVFKFDPNSGSNVLLFTNPVIGDSFGMTYDGTDLWITDHGTSSSVPAYAMQLDFSGTALSQFDLPDHYMSGIAYDNGDFWVATYYPDPSTIYKVDASGNILIQFQAPDDQPWDIAVHEDNLWVVDYNADLLFKIDQAGNILESHDCENVKPAGVVFDGQYLWYVDGGLGTNSTLYKVDLGGVGTPHIEVPVTEYNYGNVTVGDSSVWDCTINNTGTADLEITNLVVQNAVPIFVYMTFPQIIAPGDFLEIPFVFKPTETGNLNTSVDIESNDPVTPIVDVALLGEAVFDGPHILVPQTSHNYGNVRMNANTRWFLQIQNDGNTALEVNNITVSDPAFYLGEEVVFPISVGVLETKEIGIWFSPEAATSFEATAEIEHNDATQPPVSIDLSGSGVDQDYPMGDGLWDYTINTSYDNSIKAIAPIGDVSGDGIADVIVCSEDNYVRCFNGNSSGLADILWENEAGSVYSQNDLSIIEDIDNDGFEDVVVGFGWGVRAIKAFSGKTGEILWVYDTHVYGDGGWVYQVFAETDYTNDGINDVLAATGNDGNNTGPKRVFCLDGLTGIPIWEANTNGPNFAVIGVADFTNDGIPDVVAGASNNQETQGMVYGIDGSNGFIEWTFPASGSSVWALEQLDDITNDGVSDVISGDFLGNYYLMDATNGIPQIAGNTNTSLLLRFERLEDVNNDGFADIAVAHAGANAIMLDGQTGENLWTTPLADKCWNIDKIGDVNGDGINDLIAGTLFSTNRFYFLNGVDGEVLFSQNYTEVIDAIAAIPDITGDGSMEMVVGGRNGKLSCYSGGLNITLLNADFSADETTGNIPFEVHFADLSTGDITDWEWDFDNDGTIDSYDQNPTYTYNNIGTYTVSLKIINGSQSDTETKVDYVTADSLTGIVRNEVLFDLRVSPNPMVSGTQISFTLPNTDNVSIAVFDISGRKVATVLDKKYLNAGRQSVFWNGEKASGQTLDNGIYFIRLNIGDRAVVQKMVKN